jgi:hypothetical protein
MASRILKGQSPSRRCAESQRGDQEEEERMSRAIVLRSLALILVTLAPHSTRLAAQDAPSVAEAAKRAQQQKQNSAKPAKVITDDTLSRSPAAAPSAPADSSTPAATAQPALTNDGTSKPADTPEDAEQKMAEIDSLKKQIAAKQDEISTHQRGIALDEQNYYSNPNRPRDPAERERIDREKSDLDRMQAEMADLKAKLEELGVAIEPKPPAPRESITRNAPPRS